MFAKSMARLGSMLSNAPPRIRLEGAAVHVLFADALAEVQEAGKFAAALPRGDDGFDGGFARAFNRAECVADFHVRIRREAVVGFVDVGRQELDAVGAAIVVEMLELVGGCPIQTTWLLP